MKGHTRAISIQPTGSDDWDFIVLVGVDGELPDRTRVMAAVLTAVQAEMDGVYEQSDAFELDVRIVPGWVTNDEAGLLRNGWEGPVATFVCDEVTA